MDIIRSIFIFLVIVFLYAAAEEKNETPPVNPAYGDAASAASEKKPSSGKKDTSEEKSGAEKVAAAKVATPVVEEAEEELILDGGEEHIISPAAAEKPIQKSKDTVSSETTASKESSTPEAPEVDSATQSVDSATTEAEQPVFRYPAEAMPKLDNEESAVQPRIEEVRSIDFARNYKEYRSPKIAILLSLLFPGAGQAYANNMLKTGIFAAVEAAFITTGAIFAYRGNIKRKEARAFADAHYSVDSFKVYYENLKNSFPNTDSTVFLFETPPDTFFHNAEKKDQDYYSIISRDVSPYIQGWDDVRPRYDKNFELIKNIYIINKDTLSYFVHPDPESTYLSYEINQKGDTSLAQYGFSENIKEYNRRLSKANAFFRSSERLFTFMLLNHIVSAVDAAITAKAHNDQLLGKKSVWQKFNLREKFVNTPSGTANGFALEVRF